MVLMSLQEDEFMQTRSEMGVDFRRPLGDDQRIIGHPVYGSAITDSDFDPMAVHCAIIWNPYSTQLIGVFGRFL